MDMNFARLELTPSNPKSGIVTIWPYYQNILFFRDARQTRDTPHAWHNMHSTTKGRGGDDWRSQLPIEQLATAVHRGSATRSWCGPLLLVLLGGVVMLVFSACCLMSRFLRWVSGKKHKTSEILIQLRYWYLIQTILTFPSTVSVDLSHTAAADGYTDRRLRWTQLL